MPLIDLTGQKFGRWIVKEQAPSRNGISYWMCECECGKVQNVRGQSLRNGRSQSCGCYKRDFWSKDITNVRFGRLVAISKTGKNTKDNYVIWNCKCDCGNECEVDIHSLQKGNTQSCGCLRKERAVEATSKNRIDLLGKNFGKLTVIEDKGVIDGHHCWRCSCECGNEVVVKGDYLRSGRKMSCGCLKKSVGEYNIENVLKLAQIQYTAEYNPGNNKFFDFALLDNNNNVIRLIEFDGIQHYEEVEFFHKRNLIQTQQSDKVKNEYALSHNIPLVRIPYWERDNITLEMIMGDKYLVREAD